MSGKRSRDKRKMTEYAVEKSPSETRIKCSLDQIFMILGLIFKALQLNFKMRGEGGKKQGIELKDELVLVCCLLTVRMNQHLLVTV